MEIFVSLWVISGIAAHMDYCLRKDTWCGVPIWQEPSTYVMFIVAAIAGPILWLIDDDGRIG
jgi:hypothetical protein